MNMEYQMQESHAGSTDEARSEGGCRPLAVFWDMDGTLIDSEPYWHQAEMDLAREHGGDWNADMGWQVSGRPLPKVAKLMRDRGLGVPEDQIPDLLIDGVIALEAHHMPWIDGVRDILAGLVAAGIPSILVTTSPRRMAQAVVAKAPEGAFADYVCGDDGLAQKPDPAPYLHAASLLDINSPAQMASCLAFEDTLTGITSAVASGATTVAYTGANPVDTSSGPQFASINSYVGVTLDDLSALIARRLGRSESSAA
ncbi:HAD family hydrolase [Bifidobacterium asteroides]|uniref:HAD family hydrolase n=2 Tax=Bifidobacterium TaxID=1678 RepID=A0A318M1Y6_9BIFI|nr:HAD family hydrolase [Bifidobacterium asteroides]